MRHSGILQHEIVSQMPPHGRHGQTVRIYSISASGLEEELMNQADPFLQPQCRVVKSEKKIKVGYVSLRVGGTIKTVYMKQHNALSIGHRLASLFCPSAAVRSLRGALTLMRAGYATAQPIAAVEYRRRGFLVRSLYLSEEVSGAKTVDSFWHEDLSTEEGGAYRKRRAFLRALAQLLNSLHTKRIYHNDFKASNILVRDGKGPLEGLFSIIDLQGLKQCFYVSERRRIKNLAQLDRTLGCFLSRTEKLFFLKAYGGYASLKQNRALIDSILAETRRQSVRELARAPLPSQQHSSQAAEEDAADLLVQCASRSPALGSSLSVAAPTYSRDSSSQPCR